MPRTLRLNVRGFSLRVSRRTRGLVTERVRMPSESPAQFSDPRHDAQKIHI